MSGAGGRAEQGTVDAVASSHDGDSVVTRAINIVNRRGLHARAAARFVKLAATFDAQVSVVKRDAVVSGLSIMGLMMLAAGPGCEVTLAARGRQKREAVAALAQLIAAKFDEEE
jgi:phosphocarrier protein